MKLETHTCIFVFLCVTNGLKEYRLSRPGMPGELKDVFLVLTETVV
jgi:hypothetical protein